MQTRIPRLFRVHVPGLFRVPALAGPRLFRVPALAAPRLARVLVVPGPLRVLTVRRLLRVAALPVLLAACGDLLGPELARAPGAPRPPAPAGERSSESNPLKGETLFVSPSSHAARQAELWRSTRPADAAHMDYIAAQPHARWLGDWTNDVPGAAASATTAAHAAGALPVFVAYNIPLRDCGSYSAGGAENPDAYRAWVRALADGIGGRKAVVILEPDALAALDCLSGAERDTRYELIRYAVSTLRAAGSVAVYLDAGHARWHSAATMAERLARAGIADATGFALNVSNFHTDAANTAYGQELAARVGGKHFVIDSSRNGLGPSADFAWCNPPGRALGRAPTTSTEHALVDAYLWIKAPGESDGTCNGGPAAGQWWPEYALGLAQRSGTSGVSAP